MLGGIFMCFCGRRLFKVAIFSTAAIATVALVLIIFYSTFLKANSEAWVGWLVLSSSIILGIIVGAVVTKLERVGAAVIAGWGGFMLGLLLNETILFLANSEAVFWCVALGCAGACAILAFCAFNHAIILSTSFIGAYFFWRGVSLYAGGFPNEFTLIEEIKNGVIDGINPWFYAYMTAIVITCVLSSIWQYKQFRKMEAHEQNPYDRLK